MKSYHQAAIAILKDLEDDDPNVFREIVYALAIAQPSALVKLRTKTSQLSIENYMKMQVIPTYSKIASIKIYRALSKEGLKEAKNYIENLLAENPSLMCGEKTNVPLSHESILRTYKAFCSGLS